MGQQLPLNQGSTTYKWSRNVARPTNLDLILLPRRRPVGIIATAAPHAEEQIVVVTILVPKATLLCLRRRRHKRNLRRGRDWLDHLGGRRRHLDLKQIAPEGAEVHVKLAIGGLQVPINRVEIAARYGLYTRAAQIGPRAYVHGGRSSHADGGVLASEGRHAVVEIVGASNLGDVGGPEVLVAGFVDLRAVRQGGAFVGPWALDGGRGVHCYFPAGAEAEVGPIVAADQGWVVAVGTGAAA